MDKKVRWKGIRLSNLEDDSMSMPEEEPSSPQFNILQKTKSQGHCLKLPNIKQSFSSPFLEMMAKTFDKQRKRNREGNMNEKHFEFWEQSVKKFKAKGLTSIDDLIYYVEKTRPPVWNKDTYRRSPEIPAVKPTQRILKSKSGIVNRIPNKLKLKSYRVSKRSELITSPKREFC